MRALRSIVILALLSVLLAPSTAAAQPSTTATQRCTADSVAAIDQYCDLLPTAEGSAPIDTPQPRLRLRSTLPQAERVQLWQAGPAGRALLSMPQGARLRAGGPTPDAQPLPGAARAVALWVAKGEPQAASLRTTSRAAFHGGRLSELFRWLLLMSTVGLVGTAWVRRR